MLSAYSPVSLLATLAAWLALTLAGFVGIYIGLDGLSWRTALELSGSSLFTLGFSQPEGLDSTLLVFTEAVIGLFLLALLITYLPSIYSAFSRRELAVTALEIRAGAPPSGRELLWRYFRLERAHLLGELWAEWEHWFVDVEETHTSLPALVFFRSPQPDHSWVTAAGAVLDGASLVLSSVELPRDVQAEFCIRAGYLSLRRIADSFRIPYDRDPSPDDPISIAREEWEEVLDSFVSQGIPVKADRDRAWRDFAGWRVNYDTVLLALANLTSAPFAFWSSDRAGQSQLPATDVRGHATAARLDAWFEHHVDDDQQNTRTLGTSWESRQCRTYRMSRESLRSASTLPPVWQLGQYVIS